MIGMAEYIPLFRWVIVIHKGLYYVVPYEYAPYTWNWGDPFTDLRAAVTHLQKQVTDEIGIYGVEALIIKAGSIP